MTSKVNAKGIPNNELDDLDSKNHIQRFEKYDGDYAHYLMGKYKDSFNLSGGGIVDTTMESVENENISSSRFQFVRSHSDPIVGVEVKRSTAQKKRKRFTR